jgi:hypothetical protein
LDSYVLPNRISHRSGLFSERKAAQNTNLTPLLLLPTDDSAVKTVADSYPHREETTSTAAMGGHLISHFVEWTSVCIGPIGGTVAFN